VEARPAIEEVDLSGDASVVGDVCLALEFFEVTLDTFLLTEFRNRVRVVMLPVFRLLGYLLGPENCLPHGW